jgi:hypothetical protein
MPVLSSSSSKTTTSNKPADVSLRRFLPLDRSTAALALLVGLALPVLAAPPAVATGPAWSQLAPAQQKALTPLRGDWDNLDAARKQKWLEVASRFGTMPPQQQERVRERMTEWARLSPSQRTEARINYQQSKQVAPQDRQARWEAYQALTPEERAALAARAKPSPVKSQPRSPSASLRNAPVDAQAPKSNIVAPTRGNTQLPKPVAPTIVQGSRGATTSLVTATPRPPLHQRPGQPKIAATPRQVDKTTLLPKPDAALPRPVKSSRVSPAPSGATPQTAGAASSAQ